MWRGGRGGIGFEVREGGVGGEWELLMVMVMGVLIRGGGGC